MNVSSKISNIVKVGIFAAITFLGIQMFRIPLPAAVGTPFVHFGHIFVVLGVLLLGGKYGAISGTLGLLIFDLVNGYIHSMPQICVETIVKCLLLGYCFTKFKEVFKDKKSGETIAVFISTIIYGILGIVIDLIMGTILLMISGSGFVPAFIGSVTSIPAATINVIFTIVIVTFIYPIVRRTYNRVNK